MEPIDPIRPRSGVRPVSALTRPQGLQPRRERRREEDDDGEPRERHHDPDDQGPGHLIDIEA